MTMSELVEAHLTEEEAQTLYELLPKVHTEIREQLTKQGIDNDPIMYKTLIRTNTMDYLEERYGCGNDE